MRQYHEARDRVPEPLASVPTEPPKRRGAYECERGHDLRVYGFDRGGVTPWCELCSDIRRENSARGQKERNAKAQAERGGLCVNGHDMLDPENRYEKVAKFGTAIVCLTCKRASTRRSNAKARAKKLAGKGESTG